MRTPDISAELHLVKRRLQPLQPGHRGVAKGNTGFLPMHEDALYSKPSPQRTQAGDGEQVLSRWRKGAEPVTQFVTQLINRDDVGNSRQSPIDIELRFL